MGASKEKMPPAFHHTEKMLLFLCDGKHNQTPDPSTEKAEDASFQTATEQYSIISSSIYDIPECRTIPENTLTVRESDSVMPSGLSIFYSFSLSLITLPG